MAEPTAASEAGTGAGTTTPEEEAFLEETLLLAILQTNPVLQDIKKEFFDLHEV